MVVPVIFFAFYEKRIAREINSPSLTADAEHWKADIAPIAIVAVGLVGAKFSYTVLDRVAAFMVLIVVVKAGYGILRDSLKSLLDASVDPSTLAIIRDTVKSFPEVKEISLIRARNSGRFVFITLELVLSLKRLKDAHGLSLSLEKEIGERVPFVERIIIHYTPEEKEYQRYAVPLDNPGGDVSDHFAKAPFVALCDLRISDGQVCSKEVLENPFTTLEKGKGLRLAEFLVERQIDVLYTKEDFSGKGPAHVFSDADVEVRKTDAGNMAEIVHLSSAMTAGTAKCSRKL
jgi:predicted Fe-Mo cluster-binding NifX family protein